MCVCVRPSVCMYVCVCLCPSVCLYVCLCLYVCMCVCLFVCLSVCVCVCMHGEQILHCMLYLRRWLMPPIQYETILTRLKALASHPMTEAIQPFLDQYRCLIVVLQQRKKRIEVCMYASAYLMLSTENYSDIRFSYMTLNVFCYPLPFQFLQVFL